MVKFVIDSGSDITPAEAEKLNVSLMPLTVTFSKESFKSGYEITNDMFYEKLASCDEMPQTSQVNPYDFEKEFRKILDESEKEDEIVCILMSSGMSGTYQSAVMAKDEIGTDRITVIDSKNVSGGYGLLVYEALKLRDQGANAAEIKERIEDLVPRVRLYIILDTLEYLRKGGRISSSVAFIGGVLGLHPVVSVVDGEVAMLDKVKGKKSANKWLLAQLSKVKRDPSVSMVLVHSNAPEKPEALKEQLLEMGIDDIAAISCMGPIVGTHGGANAIGMMYVEEA